MEKKECLNCNKEFERGNLSDFNWGRKKFCCRECMRNFNRRENSEKAREHYLKLKSKSKCSMCGWKEHFEILSFHHTIRVKNNRHLGSCKSRQEVKEQLKKGVFLCPNCHTWIHYSNGDFFLSKIEAQKRR